MLRFLFIVTSIFCCFIAVAQEQVITFDTTHITQRPFSKVALENYKADPAFHYDMKVRTSGSWWEKFWHWVWEKIDGIFETETGQNAMTAIFTTFAVIILVIAALVFSGMRNAGMFGKKNKEEAFGYEVTEDDIHAINFDTAIEQAVNNRNFRLAVRLLYLQTLKNLADAGLINWQLNKTNIAYVNELNGDTHQQNFRNLTLQFENNWYGELPIEAMEFRAVRDQFIQFNQKLP